MITLFLTTFIFGFGVYVSLAGMFKLLELLERGNKE